jgi:GNAT superfamily N-acetyltransferase
MTAIRDCRPEDHDRIVELSLRAWAPIFASVGEVLGEELHTLLHGPDWREYQASDVRAALEDPAKRMWVAEDATRVVGFAAAAVVDAKRLIGEIHMVAVDPEAQRHGVGSSLTEHAATWLRGQGMRVAVIGTGGDPGHAPARRVYERLGFRLFPSAQYFRALHPPESPRRGSRTRAPASNRQREAWPSSRPRQR